MDLGVTLEDDDTKVVLLTCLTPTYDDTAKILQVNADMSLAEMISTPLDLERHQITKFDVEQASVSTGSSHKALTKNNQKQLQWAYIGEPRHKEEYCFRKCEGITLKNKDTITELVNPTEESLDFAFQLQASMMIKLFESVFHI